MGVFIKITKSGPRRYVQLVESFREEGRVKQRTLASLGRLERIAPEVESIVGGLRRLVSGEEKTEAIDPALVDFAPARSLGDVWTLDALWKSFGLDRLDDVFRRRGSPRRTAVEAMLRVMVFNRLCDPASKLGILRWLETTSVPGIDSESVRHQHLLRAMDALIEHHGEVDELVAELLLPHVDTELSAVFYDLTTIRAEGLSEQEGEVRRHGISKEGGIRRQFVLGVVQTAEGLPLHHEVHEGNVAEVRTLKGTLERVMARFPIRRVIAIADRGADVGGQPRRAPVDDDALGRATRVRARRARSSLRRVRRPCWPAARRTLRGFERGDGGRARVERTTTDRRARSRAGGRARRETRGDDRRPRSAGERVGRQAREAGPRQARPRTPALGRRGAGEVLPRGARGEAGEHHPGRSQERALQLRHRREGAPTRRTDGREAGSGDERGGLGAGEIIERYKSLADIERGFRVLKSEIEIGPVHHRLPDRIRAHASVCFLALILHRLMRSKLREGLSALSPERALGQLGRIQHHRVTLGERPHEGVTTLTGEQSELLDVLGVEKPALA